MRDRRVEVCSRNLAHEQDDRHDHECRGDHCSTAADRAGEGVTHHAATGRHQYEEERPQHLGEEAPPLLAGVVEVLDALHDLLLVAGERS